MPIAGLSDQVRISRDFKVLLGEPMAGRTFPKEVDYFVLKDAPEDVRSLYSAQPKSLRIMLYAEHDAVNADGDELVWNLNNRAYGAAKGLKCKGHGESLENPDSAVTSDQAYANRIEQATKVAPVPLPSLSGTPMWKVVCLGRDCPKYHLTLDLPDPQDPSKTKSQLAPGHDHDASCGRVALFRCYLLDPERDPAKPNYCKPLGVMEIGTTSINAIKDVQGALRLEVIRYAGRTAGVPLTLVRRPVKTYRGAPTVHYPCDIRFDVEEVQRWAAIPLNEIFLSEAQRTKLKQLAAAPLGLTVDSVAGLLPSHLVPEETRANLLRGSGVPVAAPGGGQSGDPAEPPSVAAGSQAGPSDGDAFLVAAELDELKELAGGREDATRPWSATGNPWRREAIDRLKGAVAAMNAEAGTEVKKLTELRVMHVAWLKERLRSLPPLEVQS